MTFLDMLYPRRCPLCDELCEKKDRYVCRKCRGKVTFLTGDLCCRCGRPIDEEDGEYCFVCSRRNHVFLEGFAPFVYDTTMQQSMMRFKYGQRAEYANFYAAAILHFGEEKFQKWNIQAVIPVPVHRLRQIRRGYNQAEEIASRIAKKLQVPDYGKQTRRLKNSKPQKNLSQLQRKYNLRNIFQIDPAMILPENVLLVDDIYTTGSTINELASEARRRGAKNVYFCCACIGTARKSPLHTL